MKKSWWILWARKYGNLHTEYKIKKIMYEVSAISTQGHQFS